MDLIENLKKYQLFAIINLQTNEIIDYYMLIKSDEDNETVFVLNLQTCEFSKLSKKLKVLVFDNIEEDMNYDLIEKAFEEWKN